MVGDNFQQLIELGDAQALAEVGFEQTLTLADGQAVSALEFDAFNREAARISGRRWLGRLSRFTRQLFEIFEAALLLFQQALLALANQLLIARCLGNSLHSVEPTQTSQYHP
ncbi:hypothetical protein PS880_05903 [Pseudomonas fluorescens]|uniref:Uncharacterized protein n=1 Tax=Pseudomonas fluorescens TaxID=294 RepID=A0A5E7Q9E1_PSEFL|nr:hypothetical protein PS880_05903 [Pseudomonas fluorescens]